jgi:hypothetical protein
VPAENINPYWPNKTAAICTINKVYEPNNQYKGENNNGNKVKCDPRKFMGEASNSSVE